MKCSIDHGRPQLGGRNWPLSQNVTHLMPATQVGRQSFRAFAQTTQIDDVFDSGLACRVSEVVCRLAVALLKIAFTAGHRVDQVIRRSAAGQSLYERTTVEHIAGHDFNLIAPTPAQKLPRVACQTANSMTSGHQLRHQPAADVAACTSDENGLHARCSVRSAGA